MAALLISIVNPFPDVNLIQVYKPYQTHNTIAYPVTIDGLKTTLENTGTHKWQAKGFGQALTQELIDHIGDKIEQAEL